MALVNDFDFLIFDYGGVLVTHQTEEDQVRMAHLIGAEQEAFSEAYWANRTEYDRGALSATEYWLEVMRECKASRDVSVIDRLTELDSTSWMHFDEPMWDWLDQLRSAKKRLAILSNMPRDLGDALRTQTDRLDAFDQVTLSFQVRSVKPEPAIYEHCLEGLGAEPHRALFLDDRMENIQGAELLGIRAIQFLDRDEALLQLR